MRLDLPGSMAEGTVAPVESAAHAFLLSLIAARRPPGTCVWVLGGSPRHRDRLADELRAWEVPALHLPAPPPPREEHVLEDAEGEADRFAAFQSVATHSGAPLVVLADEDFPSSRAPAPRSAHKA